jgi:hypothetical protein
MPFTYLANAYATQALNGMLASSAPSAPPTLYLSIHDSTGPGQTGANEIPANQTSGTRGYSQSARPAVTWSTTTNGTVYSASASLQQFTLTLAETFGTGGLYFGLWTASSSGTYITGGQAGLVSTTIPQGATIVFTGTGTSGSGITLSITG